jgi:hypothetical protein
MLVAGSVRFSFSSKEFGVAGAGIYPTDCRNIFQFLGSLEYINFEVLVIVET